MSAMRALLLGSYSKRSTTAVSSLWEREKSTCDIQDHIFGVRLLLTHLEDHLASQQTCRVKE